MDAHYQSGNACLKIFTGWLEGGHDLKPAMWDVLIQSLKDVKLTKIADLLHSTIDIVSFMPIALCVVILFLLLFSIQEAEDASTLSTMAVGSISPVASSTHNTINENVKCMLQFVCIIIHFLAIAT